MIFHLLGWLVFGLIVGAIAHLFYHVQGDPRGLLWTIGTGVAGSFVGGFIHFLLWGGDSAFSSSGYIFSIIGAIVLMVVFNLFFHKN